MNAMHITASVFINDNEVVLARTKGIGVIEKDYAINSSVTGPILRATGVNWD